MGSWEDLGPRWSCGAALGKPPFFLHLNFQSGRYIHPDLPACQCSGAENGERAETAVTGLHQEARSEHVPARPSGTQIDTRGHARAEMHTYARITCMCACTSIWRHSRGGVGPGRARVVTDTRTCTSMGPWCSGNPRWWNAAFPSCPSSSGSSGTPHTSHAPTRAGSAAGSPSPTLSPAHGHAYPSSATLPWLWGMFQDTPP